MNNLNNINNKIYERNLPSGDLKPYISQHPLGTKYTKFLILENNSSNNDIVDNYNNYKTFYPGTRKAPFNGFSNKIDDESILRNQVYKLQKSDLNVWAPSSGSDLYNNHLNENNIYRGNNHLLFNTESFNDFNPNYNINIGSELFNNSTRVQLKNI